ncbi:unnamed protein product, partial [Choristocarpus tenellus]
MDSHNISTIFPDIFIRGTYQALVVRAKILVKKTCPISFIAYNDKTRDLIGTAGEYVHFWDLQTSDPLRHFRTPSKQEITCITTDQPDQSRLFIGTVGGNISEFCMVTGQV